MRSAWIVGSLLVVSLAACGPDSQPEDGGGLDASADASGPACSVDADCAGDFCDGERRCRPGPSGRLSCVVVEPACEAGWTCNEAMRLCVSECDADGDGVEAIVCGGTDCDDDDPDRFPGNPEVCDPDHHDEDCDPTTFGWRDADDDDYPDAACCNRADDGTLLCGTDCDDTRAAVNPAAAEICDGLDNDCDPSTWALGEDDDGDGFADATCGGNDCDDECPTCHPGGGPELCDGLDQDCDGSIDEGVDPALYTTFYRDADEDGVGDGAMTVDACVAPPGYVADAGDCNDGSAFVGVCSAPLGCVAETACGCQGMLLNNAQWLDLDAGTVSLNASPSGGRDVMVNQGLGGAMFLRVPTGARYRRYEPADFLEVDATYATGVTGTGEDTMEWTASTVYVVRSTEGVHYKLGLFENPAGIAGVRFVYAPLETPPSGFACQM